MIVALSMMVLVLSLALAATIAVDGVLEGPLAQAFPRLAKEPLQECKAWIDDAVNGDQTAFRDPPA